MKGVSRVLFIFALIVGVLFSNKTAISIGTNAHMKDVVLDDVLTQIKLTSQKKERKQDSIIDNIGIIETPESTIRDWETIQSFRELENDRSGPSYTIPEISDPSNSSTFDPDIVNVSPGKFVYEKFSYNNIQKGDIIFETHVSDALNYIGHIAFVYDVAKPFSDGTNSGTFIETIEAVPSSVRFGWLDDNRMKTQGVVILRPVYANSTNINQASYFVYGQLGKPYNFPYDSGRVNTSYYSANWYCS